MARKKSVPPKPAVNAPVGDPRRPANPTKEHKRNLFFESWDAAPSGRPEREPSPDNCDFFLDFLGRETRVGDWVAYHVRIGREVYPRLAKVTSIARAQLARAEAWRVGLQPVRAELRSEFDYSLARPSYGGHPRRMIRVTELVTKPFLDVMGSW